VTTGPRCGVHRPTSSMIIGLLSDGQPKSLRSISKQTGIPSDAVEACLGRLFHDGRLLRSAQPLRKRQIQPKGRAGLASNLRSYHLYMLRPKGVDSLEASDIRFVPYRDPTGIPRTSKCSKIRAFLETNVGKAYFSTELVERLKVKPADVMPAARRFERQGLVLIRGYREANRETPFRKGYLLTWIDCTLGRDAGIRKALETTSLRLADEEATNPVIRRIRIIRDCIVTASAQKELVSKDFLRDKLDCSETMLDTAISRVMQLYPDIAQVKLFDAYPHYYLASMDDADLSAAVQLKENYIRKVQGSANRQGHNFEAAVAWFVEKTTQGAKFRSQQHRGKGIHPRRITTHLIRAVGDRRMNAELDRVWEVSPGPLQPPITFVLECKSNVVRKRDLDEFQNVLRYSVDFGVDTPDGRAIRNGIVGVFAGGTFDPTERIRFRSGEVLSLSQYAARSNIQLIRTADLNEKLVQRGVDKQITVQRICRDCRDEEEVREILDRVWESPENAISILAQTALRNKSIFDLEHKLEMPTPRTSKIKVPAVSP
jgi:biotin operon repressor